MAATHDSTVVREVSGENNCVDDVSRLAPLDPHVSQDAVDASDEWLLRTWARARGPPRPRPGAEPRLSGDPNDF